MKRDRSEEIEWARTVDNGIITMSVKHTLNKCSLRKFKKIVLKTAKMVIRTEKSTDKKLRKELSQR